MASRPKAKNLILYLFLSIFGVFVWFLAPLLTKPLMNLNEMFIQPLQYYNSYFLGTDAFGRSVLSLLFYSAYESLMTSILVSVASLLFSFLILFLVESGFFSKVILWMLHVLNIFPSLLLILVLKTLLGGGTGTFWLVMMIGSIPHICLVLIQTTQTIKTDESVLASKAMGASPYDLLRTHYFPRLLALFIPKWIFLISSNLIAEASLTYLGIGLPPDHLSWGSFIVLSKEYLLEAPYLMIICGISLLITLSSLRSLIHHFKLS